MATAHEVGSPERRAPVLRGNLAGKCPVAHAHQERRQFMHTGGGGERAGHGGAVGCQRRVHQRDRRFVDQAEPQVEVFAIRLAFRETRLHADRPGPPDCDAAREERVAPHPFVAQQEITIARDLHAAGLSRFSYCEILRPSSTWYSK
ncbi:MAG: hypothetical protein H0X13_10375 [Ramlibacter sp.]|nr:hypothetical protein [Ramlibacter sp.]